MDREPLKVWLNKDDEYDSASRSHVRQFVILSEDMINSLIHSSHMTLHTAPLWLSGSAELRMSASHCISFVTHLHLGAHGTVGVKPAVRLLLLIQPSD